MNYSEHFYGNILSIAYDINHMVMGNKMQSYQSHRHLHCKYPCTLYHIYINGFRCQSFDVHFNGHMFSHWNVQSPPNTNTSAGRVTMFCKPPWLLT